MAGWKWVARRLWFHRVVWWNGKVIATRQCGAWRGPVPERLVTLNNIKKYIKKTLQNNTRKIIQHSLPRRSSLPTVINPFWKCDKHCQRHSGPRIPLLDRVVVPLSAKLTIKWCNLDQFYFLPSLDTTWIGCKFVYSMAPPAICKQEFFQYMMPHPLFATCDIFFGIGNDPPRKFSEN